MRVFKRIAGTAIVADAIRRDRLAELAVVPGAHARGIPRVAPCKPSRRVVVAG